MIRLQADIFNGICICHTKFGYKQVTEAEFVDLIESNKNNREVYVWADISLSSAKLLYKEYGIHR